MSSKAHPSHDLEWRDSSHYDFVCKNCDTADTPSGWGKLIKPCVSANNKNEYIEFSTRKGKFVLNRELIIDNYKSVMGILSTVLVIRAENDFMTDTITYWAYSEHFEPIAEGLAAPEYEAVITKQENATDVVTWRIKE